MMGFGMLFLVPLMGLSLLAIVAVPMAALFWIARQSASMPVQMAPQGGALAPVCASCHRTLQASWRNCPYCGQPVA